MAPLYIFLVYLVWFLSIFFVVFLLLLLFSGVPLYETRKWKGKLPFISILVPAYNEEAKIAYTIDSLKQITYPHVEFIVINDGSNDKTSQVVKKAIGTHPKFAFIDRKENRGKAASLNQGIEHSKGEFIMTMDADSCIEPGIIEKVLPYFQEKDVGAVTVSVKVKNPKTFVEKIIEIEYLIGLSLFLKLFSAINCVFVTPGPFSGYRKSMLTEIGGFDKDNIVEDHEIAYRIHKAGYKIKNCMEAAVETILPETFKGLYIQRRRWYSGAVQTLIQHKNMCFKSKYGLFGYFAPFNQILIFFGLMLFFYTTYMGVTNIIDNVMYFQYVDLDIIERIKDFSFDIFSIQKTWVFGLSSLAATVVLLFAGLRAVQVKWKTKKTGVFGYVFMFLLYQIFWIGAYFAVIKGKKVKWR